MGDDGICYTNSRATGACTRRSIEPGIAVDDCLRSNVLLLIAVLVTLALQMALVYLPPFQALFNTVPPTLGDLPLCLVLSTIVFWAVELEKWWLWRADAKRGEGIE